MKFRTSLLFCLLLFLLALFGQWGFTHKYAVPVDDEPDGEIYLALAHNLFAHGVYSCDAEPNLAPTYIRLPGYPLLIATVFAACGDGNQGAVRDLQALLATLTCVLVAWLAFLWEPDPERGLRAATAAFLLAAVCPFTAIYSGIILTETLTFFLVMLLMLAATWALRARSTGAAIGRWIGAGLLAGAVQMVRPESGLFAAAVGFTLTGFGLFGPGKNTSETGRSRWLQRCPRVFRNGAAFSCAFAVALAPWTLRNASVFHVFAPLPPVTFSLPGQMDYRGFCTWYGTWADSEDTLQPYYWDMPDSKPANVENLPPGACDTPEETARTAALFERYNAPVATDIGPGSSRAALTPALDNAFGQLARERIARSPWRYYFVLPLRRSINLWFVPHAQYYEFDGSSLGFWLHVFFTLTCAYTALGVAGMWRLLRTRGSARADAWQWLGLVILVILPRWAYLSTMANTEPRYMAEIFPLLSVLGGLALAGRRPIDQRLI